MTNKIITGGQYTDPSDWNGQDVNTCLKCHNNDAMEDFDICTGCSDDLDEMSTVSVCCEASINTDINICSSCLDHSESILKEYSRENDYCNKHGKYNCKKHGV